MQKITNDRELRLKNVGLAFHGLSFFKLSVCRSQLYVLLRGNYASGLFFFFINIMIPFFKWILFNKLIHSSDSCFPYSKHCLDTMMKRLRESWIIQKGNTIQLMVSGLRLPIFSKLFSWLYTICLKRASIFFRLEALKDDGPPSDSTAWSSVARNWTQDSVW